MTKLKNYHDHQKELVPDPKEPKSSGVACTEKKCKGEMMISQPEVKHPELKQLKRAICNKCNWKGWV